PGPRAVRHAGDGGHLPPALPGPPSFFPRGVADARPVPDEPVPQPVAAAPGAVRPAPVPAARRALPGPGCRPDRLAGRAAGPPPRGPAPTSRPPSHDRRPAGRAPPVLLPAASPARLVRALLPRVGPAGVRARRRRFPPRRDPRPVRLSGWLGRGP